MKTRLATLLAVLSATAFVSTLEGASPRIALSGGPLASSELASVPVVRASPTAVRPLQPGEMLVLGPIAGPVTAPPAPAPAPVPAAAPAVSAPAVDTVTVRAPAFVPETGTRSSQGARGWDDYRSASVVRIDLR
jgi:hypothetical protein